MHEDSVTADTNVLHFILSFSGKVKKMNENGMEEDPFRRLKPGYKDLERLSPTVDLSMARIPFPP
jgi:hypothetical protein